MAKFIFTAEEVGKKDVFDAAKLCELYEDSDLAALYYLVPYCSSEQAIELEHLIKLNLKWIEGEAVEVRGREEDYHERKWQLFQQFGVRKDTHSEMILAEEKEKKILKAINIKWDTDGDVELLKSLPTEMDIPEYLENTDIDVDGYEEDISDWLSNQVGFCHNGFELVKEFPME